MTTNIIQMIYLQKEKYHIALKGIIPDMDSVMRGTIIICGNPIKCERKERYSIENNMVITDSWHFPIEYLTKWLYECGSVVDNNGEQLVVIQEIQQNNKHN